MSTLTSSKTDISKNKEIKTNVIPKENFQDLKNWKYCSKCSSVLYNNVTGHFAEFLVNYVPKGVAPNTVTAFAFFFSSISMVLSFIDCGLNNERYASTSICYISAACYFTYQTLDNIDGKLARKLKASSALGFFFDHNLDSYSISTITITGMSIFGLTSSFENNLIYLATTIAFFMTTWEEYVTGVMNLPIFSGVDEGAYVTICIFIISGYYGSDFWTKNELFGFQLKKLIMLNLLFLSSVFILIK